jgi:hypothetical protein
MIAGPVGLNRLLSYVETNGSGAVVRVSRCLGFRGLLSP